VAILRALLPFRDSGGNAVLHRENSKAKALLEMVKLLKLLDRHPDLAEEIKVA
jgi:MqsA antitoxin of toxin-antitoxin system